MASPMYYLSAAMAVVGLVVYHTLLKRIPATLDPLVSVAAIYVLVMMFSLLLLPWFVERGTLGAQLRQLSWLQVAIAAVVFLLELGYLLMYRHGWDLSVGNIVTGVFVNLALLAIGVLVLREQVSAVNLTGVLLCIVGVGMVGHTGSGAAPRSDQAAFNAAP